MDYTIRKIRPEDNEAIAKVIRSVLEEHGMNKPGTVYTDPTTDDLYTLFREPKSNYFIVEMNQEIVGGCGIYPTQGLPEGCAELVKLYLLSASRGLGIGKELLELCTDTARQLGYGSLYLESMPELNKAVGLYESVGYRQISAPLGNSGHYACDVWMLKELLRWKSWRDWTDWTDWMDWMDWMDWNYSTFRLFDCWNFGGIRCIR